MHIGIPLERQPGEARVAATPETVRALTRGGRHVVLVESGAGLGASIPDQEFETAGAIVVTTAAELYARAEVVIKVRGPESDELAFLRRGMVLVGLLRPHEQARVRALSSTGVTAFALEAVPRITRAQTMDALSSQANIAGYKAVLLAANAYGRFLPMLMTAAGTVKAARVLVLGAGVAGLQAIATARRLGAIVEAFDVRPATKEQVESLGARFVEVPLSEAERAQAETAGGYAGDLGEHYRRRQAALIDERARASDIVITTALVPGRAAPQLLTEQTVLGMRPGSVVVDLATEQGGNCALSKQDIVNVHRGVTIIGFTNLPAMVAADASALYARNVMNFLTLLIDPSNGELRIDQDDEIVGATLVCTDGSAAKIEASPA